MVISHPTILMQLGHYSGSPKEKDWQCSTRTPGLGLLLQSDGLTTVQLLFTLSCSFLNKFCLTDSYWRSCNVSAAHWWFTWLKMLLLPPIIRITKLIYKINPGILLVLALRLSALLEVLCNRCNMGTRDLPDSYVHAYEANHLCPCYNDKI